MAEKNFNNLMPSSEIAPDINVFSKASDLDADFEDAYQKMPTGAPMRSDSLQISSYTAGDTRFEADRGLPNRVLASLPSRVIRRYSAKNYEESNASPSQPAPVFIKLPKENESEEAVSSVYPEPQFRAASVAQAMEGAEVRLNVTPSNIPEYFAQGPVVPPTSASVAPLLEKLGLPVPPEARASYQQALRRLQKGTAHTQQPLSANTQVQRSSSPIAIDTFASPTASSPTNVLRVEIPNPEAQAPEHVKKNTIKI